MVRNNKIDSHSLLFVMFNLLIYDNENPLLAQILYSCKNFSLES